MRRAGDRGRATEQSRARDGCGCSQGGIGCVLAFNSDPPSSAEANQLLDVILGAERRFVGPLAMDELNAVVERIARELRGAGRRPYVIPIGGSSPLGASAYVTAAEEILADLGHDDVLVVTASASGGTQAGLAARLGHERVIGVDAGALADPGCRGPPAGHRGGRARRSAGAGRGATIPA